jgi:hypothetical protein
MIAIAPHATMPAPIGRADSVQGARTMGEV